MIEYHLIFNVWQNENGGQTIKHTLRHSDRDRAIQKWKYLENLLSDSKKNIRELWEWSRENISVQGVVVSLEGLYGVASVKIL